MDFIRILDYNIQWPAGIMQVEKACGYNGHGYDMDRVNKAKAILYAFLAAVFYAVNVPASKILLKDVGPTTMASFQ